VESKWAIGWEASCQSHQPPILEYFLPLYSSLPISHFIPDLVLLSFFISPPLLLQRERRASPTSISISRAINHRENNRIATSFTSTRGVLLQQSRGTQASVLACFCTFLFLHTCSSSFSTSLFYFPHSPPVLLFFPYPDLQHDQGRERSQHHHASRPDHYEAPAELLQTILARRTVPSPPVFSLLKGIFLALSPRTSFSPGVLLVFPPQSLSLSNLDPGVPLLYSGALPYWFRIMHVILFGYLFACYYMYHLLARLYSSTCYYGESFLAAVSSYGVLYVCLLSTPIILRTWI